MKLKFKVITFSSGTTLSHELNRWLGLNKRLTITRDDIQFFVTPVPGSTMPLITAIITYDGDKEDENKK